jgi:uncharacterized membrane protein YhaH (DUF805 family)
MKHYINAWKNYAVFKGRASRKEYWFFVLFNFLIASIFSLLDIVLSISAVGFEDTFYGLMMLRGFSTGFTFFYIFYLLAMLVPGLAFVTRRLHDIGKSGWMQLVALIPLIGPIWLLVLLLKPSDEGENKYDLVDERIDASFINLVKAVLMVKIISFVFSSLLGFLMTTNTNLAMNAFIYMPGFILSVAVIVLIILAYVKYKEENQKNQSFIAAFILFLVSFFIGNTKSLQLFLFNANTNMMIAFEWVNALISIVAMVLLLLVLVDNARKK